MNYFKRSVGESTSIALVPFETPRRSKRTWTIPYRAVAPMAMAVDTLTIFATSVLAASPITSRPSTATATWRQFAGFAAVVAALFVTLANSRNLYSLSELLNLKSQISRIAIKWTIVFLFLTAAAYHENGRNFSRGVTLMFAATGFAALVIARVGWRIYLADGVSVRKFSSRKVALIEEPHPLNPMF